MPRYTGAVRFSDGELRYFVYSSTTDCCRRPLYNTKEEAFLAWDEEPQYKVKDEGLDDEEPVEVMPYFAHGDSRVLFTSRASKKHNLITGPTSPVSIPRREFEA